MYRRKILKSLALTGVAVALGPQFSAEPENLLFQELRELNERLPLQRSYGVYHPAITQIRLCEQDWADLARNTPTPEIEFKEEPDIDDVPQPRFGLYRWIVVSLTRERCISGCIIFTSSSELFYSNHHFYLSGTVDVSRLILLREDFEWATNIVSR
jgi:hypothetical protein